MTPNFHKKVKEIYRESKNQLVLYYKKDAHPCASFFCILFQLYAIKQLLREPLNQFYKYVNTKFELKDINVVDDVPFTIYGEQYFFSHYEVNLPDKTLNLLPIASDNTLLRADFNPAMKPE